MLYVLPLEPLDERYTEQWYRWFKRDCIALGIPYQYIDGKQLGDGSVEVGTVLDAAGTCFWKMVQLSRVCELFKARKIRDGDIFFSMDAWHHGLECIPYMATLYGLDVKVWAFLHAGSYTIEDFAAPMGDWAKHFERGWFTMCEGLFVGTQYSKDSFYHRRLSSVEGLWAMSNIHVTGNPITLAEMPPLNTAPRENIIIHSNRWDKEKRPDVFVEAMCCLWGMRQDFRVFITTSRSGFKSNDPALLHILDDVPFPYEIIVGPKAAYYKTLAWAKVFVSTTIEENFGYNLVEAMASGVTPVVPNKFSHPKIIGAFPRSLVDHGVQEYAVACSQALDSPLDPKDLRQAVRTYENSFKRMIRIMTQ